jgi:hypothetical protein
MNRVQAQSRSEWNNTARNPVNHNAGTAPMKQDEVTPS